LTQYVQAVLLFSGVDGWDGDFEVLDTEYSVLGVVYPERPLVVPGHVAAVLEYAPFVHVAVSVLHRVEGT
jgi:hypothetical protein